MGAVVPLPAISAHRCSGLLTPVLRTPGGPSSSSLRRGSSAGSGRPRERLALEAPVQGRPDIDATQGGMAEGAASPEEGGGLRAGAERGRGRLRGEGGRERGVKRLWRREKRQTASTRAPSSLHTSSQPQRRVSLQCVSLSLWSRTLLS